MEPKKTTPAELLRSLERQCFEAAKEAGYRDLKNWVLLSTDLDWMAFCFRDYFDRLPTESEWKESIGYAPEKLTQESSKMYHEGVSAGRFRARKPPFEFKLSRESIEKEAGQSFVNAAWTRPTEGEDFGDYVRGYKDGYFGEAEKP